MTRRSVWISAPEKRSIHIDDMQAQTVIKLTKKGWAESARRVCVNRNKIDKKAGNRSVLLFASRPFYVIIFSAIQQQLLASIC